MTTASTAPCRIVVANIGAADRGQVVKALRERFPQARSDRPRLVLVAETMAAFSQRIAQSADQLLEQHGRAERTEIQTWNERSRRWEGAPRGEAADERPVAPPESERPIDVWYEQQTGAEIRLELPASPPGAEQARQRLKERLPHGAYLQAADGELRVYCPESAAERLTRLMEDAAREAGLAPAIRTSNWNWQTLTWQDSRFPVPERPPPVLLHHPDTCTWEVRIHMRWHESTGLAEAARRAGFLAMAADPGVVIAVQDEEERLRAVGWAADHRPGADVTWRRIGWFRHWQWREALFGNYADNGTGEPADIGDAVIDTGSENTATR